MSHRRRINSLPLKPVRRRVTRLNRTALAASVSLVSLLLANAQPAVAQEAETLPGTVMLQGGRWVGAKLPSVAQGNNGLVMTIEQQEKRALLDWSRFDIAPNEQVHFEQGGVDWIALNRIFDNKPSEIAGKITARGQVWLQNTNGIIFKDGAQVNAHTILASALPITEDHLYNGLISGNANSTRGIISGLSVNPLFGTSFSQAPMPKPVDGLDPAYLETTTQTISGQTVTLLDLMAIAVIRQAVLESQDFEGTTEYSSTYGFEYIRNSSQYGKGLAYYWVDPNFSSNGLNEVLDNIVSGVDISELGDFDYSKFTQSTSTWLTRNTNWALIPTELRNAVAARIKAQFIDDYDAVYAAAQLRYDNFIANSRVVVEAGARLSAVSEDSTSPGKIMLFGPNVSNAGTLEAHDGQVLMAAGEVIKLSERTNYTNSVRGGLSVSVMATPVTPSWGNFPGMSCCQTPTYDAWNAAYLDRQLAIGMTATNSGTILSDRGAVTLTGANVEQFGDILVTNGARQRNGTIVLQASHGFTINDSSTGGNYFGGSLTLGEGSVTSITPDTSDLTGLAADTFAEGKILLAGTDILLDAGASVVSRSGNVVVYANPTGSGARGGTSPAGPDGATQESRGNDGSFTMREGARIDVSGLENVERTVSDNVFAVEVRSNELSASPNQRDGILQGEVVYVDRRTGATIVDWTGALAAEERTAAQMSIDGGSVLIRASGSTVIEDGAVIDVSGGSTQYVGGQITTTLLQDKTGAFHDIADADADIEYVGIQTATRTEEGYVEGANAGSVEILSPSSRLFGKLVGDITVGEHQILASLGLIEAPKVPIGAIAASQAKLATMPVAGSAILHRGGAEYGAWTSDHAFIMADENAFTGAIWSGSGEEWESTDVDLDPGLVGQDWSDYEGDQPQFLQFLEADFFDGMGRVELSYGSSHRTQTINPGVSIELQPGGSFSMIGERGVMTIGDGTSITIPSGTISLGGTLGKNISLSVAAPWVNDLDAPDDTVLGFVNGGRISLFGDLTGPISLDAGGGGWYQRVTPSMQARGDGLLSQSRVGTFNLIEGKGGSIDLRSALPISEFLNHADINLTGLGGNGALWLNTGADLIVGPAGGDTGEGEYLDDSLLQDMGISSLRLDAQSISFAEGARVAFRSSNLLLADGPMGIATGTRLRDVGTLALLPDHLRNGATLDLRAPTISVAENAIVEVDPMGTLSLSAGSILLDGTLRAHGGLIDLDANLTMHSGALIDVSGLAQTVKVPGGADGRGFWYDGRILDGGTIGINGNSVLIDAGATLDVSGTTGLLAVWKPGRYSAIKVNDTIGSDGGIIGINAPGGYLLGDFLGSGGTEQNFAGTLILTGGQEGQALIAGSTNSQFGIEAFANSLASLMTSRFNSPTSLRNFLMLGELWDRATHSSIVNARNRTGLTGADLLDIQVRSQAGSSTISTTESTAILRAALDPMTSAGDADWGLLLDPTLTQLPEQMLPFGAIPIELGMIEGYDPVKYMNTVTAFMAMINLDLQAKGLRYNSQLVVGAPVVERMKQFDTVSLNGKILAEQPTSVESKRVLNIGGTISAAVDVSFKANTIHLSGGVGTIGATDAPNAGTLTISGETVQFGSTRFTVGGFETVIIEAEGDMRDGGIVQPDPAIGNTPGVYTTSDLVLRAAQIYPTTDSMLRFESTTGIRVEQTGTRAAPLSAGGELILTAPLIQQGGTLRAPFGEIRLEAVGHDDADGVYVPGTLELLDGSTTSTSADGRTILYGYTFDGQSWYPSLIATNGASLTTPPEKRVTLSGDVIDVQSGATIDVSGSGDVLGLEFVAGPLGQTNVLDAPGMFAIVPAYGNDVIAPIDPRYGTVGIGRSVWLAAFDGNAAGWYTLLPAEYSLTPGGYLISVANANQAGAVGSKQLGDKSFIVLGHEGISGTGISDQLMSTFRLESGVDVRNRSEFFETSGNTFFSSDRFLQGLARSGLAYNDDPRLPIDGGFLSIAANMDLDLDGEVLASGLSSATGARGGVVDITSDNIVIAAPGTDVSDLEGYLVLDPNKISNVAESLLIGGIRRQGAEGIEIVVGQGTRTSATQVRDPDASVGAENVIIRTDADNPLTGVELLFAANQSVVVEGGSVVRAVGDGADAADIAIAPSLPAYVTSNTANNRPAEDRGAFLRVSNLGDISVSRSNVIGDAGDLIVEADAALIATDSIILDSTRNTSVENGAILQSGAITAAAGLVSFGESPEGIGGFVASNETLAALGDARALTLKSYSTFDFYGDVTLNLADSATLDGAALVALGDTPSTVSISSNGTLQLINSDAAPVDMIGNGGALALSAANLWIGEGDIDFAFASATLDAAERLVFAGLGDNSFDGSLSVRATEITGASGAGHEIAAVGAIALLAQETPASLDPFATAGALLDFSGTDVMIMTNIVAGSGTVRATARTGDVELASNALVDVSGADVSFFDVEGFLPGGSVELTSVNGDVRFGAAAVIDISGGNSGGDAGALVVTAGDGIALIDGTINADVAGAFDHGSFALTVATLDDFGGLNGRLNDWGISRARKFAILAGDVLLNGVTQVDDLRIITGDGDITVAGDAIIRSEGDKGGTILLASGGDLSVADDAILDVSAKGSDAAGGFVELQVASGGTINVGAAAMNVAASGTGDEGEVRLRAPQLGNDVAVDGWSAAVTGGGTLLEAFRVYALADADGDASNGYLAEIDTALQQQVTADAAAFMAASAVGIRTRLGLDGEASFHIVPGIELRSAGDLDLVHNWNLKDARFDGQPGILTLRAGGDLLINANLSDGFIQAMATPDYIVPPNGWSNSQPIPELPADDLTNDYSWSYNLVAGADFGQTDVLATRAGNVGDVELGGLVRSGTGNIRVAASGDLNYEAASIVSYQFSTSIGTLITVPAGTVIPDGTVMQPTSWTTSTVRNGQPVSVTYYPRLPAGTVLRKGTQVPSGTVMPDGTTLAADLVLAEDVTLTAETMFPGTLMIAGKTYTGGALEISIPRAAQESVPGLVASDGGTIPATNDTLSQSNRIAFSIPGLGQVDVSNHVNGYNTSRLILADGRLVRDASPSNATDIRLVDMSYGAILTAGVEAAPVDGFTEPNLAEYANTNNSGGFINPLYAEKGGDISVTVGGNITGGGPLLENANWLMIQGDVEESATYDSARLRDPDALFEEGAQTSMALLPDRFKNGIGALGGGDIEIVAGGDVDNLLVALPTTVRVSGGTVDGEAKVLHMTGGGDLAMTVGGNLLGSIIQVSGGKGSIDVAGSVLASSGQTSLNPAGQTGNANNLTLVLDDAQIALQAGGDVLVRKIASTTGGLAAEQWLGYTRNSSISVTSLGGDIAYLGGSGDNILPARTSFIATAGSIAFGTPTTAMPAVTVDAWDTTSLNLLAMENVDFYTASGFGADFTIGWTDGAWVGRVTNPGDIGQLGWDDPYARALTHSGSGFGIAGPNIHSGSDSHSLIHAVEGDIRGRGVDQWDAVSQAGNSGLFAFGHEARLKAGGDIRMGEMTFISHDGADMPSIEAEGSIYQPDVIFYGPGNLWLQAGNEIWMGNTASKGVRAREAVATFTDAVPLNGGSITLLAGIDQAPEYQAFFDYYLNPESLDDAPSWLSKYFVEGDTVGLTVSTPVVLNDGTTQTTVYAIELVNFMREMRGAELIPTEIPDEVSGSREVSRGALAALIDPAEHAKALAAFKALDPALQRTLAVRILNAELKTAGREAVGASPETDGRSERFGDPTRGYDAIARLFPGAQRAPGEALAEGEHEWTGDIGMRVSQVRAENGGDINFVVPGGTIQLASLAVANTSPGTAGAVTQKGGDINAITHGNYIVNQSRTMTADDGNILIWSSYGNIDAGRGRKSSLSVPPVIFPVDGWGQTTVQLSGLPNGAGIATLDQVDGSQGGDVDLYAFNGIVNAGDAGIRASRDLFIGAIEIQGLDNITVGGVTNVELTAEEGNVGPLNLENFAQAAEDAALDKAFDMTAEVEKLRTVRQTILTGSVVSFGTDDCVETDTNRCPAER